MKTVNADYGIDSVPADCEKQTWYRWYRFPLLPIVDYSPGDHWNEPNICFSWLNIRAWSLMSPQLGFQIELEDLGLWFKIILPYFQIIIWLIPFPLRWHQKLWRRPNRREH